MEEAAGGLLARTFRAGEFLIEIRKEVLKEGGVVGDGGFQVLQLEGGERGDDGPGSLVDLPGLESETNGMGWVSRDDAGELTDEIPEFRVAGGGDEALRAG